MNLCAPLRPLKIDPPIEKENTPMNSASHSPGLNSGLNSLISFLAFCAFLWLRIAPPGTPSSLMHAIANSRLISPNPNPEVSPDEYAQTL
jgi:hypothetical protein